MKYQAAYPYSEDVPKDYKPVYFPKLRATCNSAECKPRKKYGKKNGVVLSGGKVKKVSKYTDFCPHCGCALFWERI